MLGPAVDDFLKLVRVLKYVYATSEQELIHALKPCTDNQLIMQVYIDASYGAHPDAKSHSGMVVTLGDGAIMAVLFRSQPQKLNSSQLLI